MIYDVFNHIVLPPKVSEEAAVGKRWNLDRRSRVRPSYKNLRRVQLHVKGHTLQFATSLDEAALRARFQRFQVRVGSIH